MLVPARPATNSTRQRSSVSPPSHATPPRHHPPPRAPRPIPLPLVSPQTMLLTPRGSPTLAASIHDTSPGEPSLETTCRRTRILLFLGRSLPLLYVSLPLFRLRTPTPPLSLCRFLPRHQTQDYTAPSLALRPPSRFLLQFTSLLSFFSFYPFLLTSLHSALVLSHRSCRIIARARPRRKAGNCGPLSLHFLS